MSITVGIDPGLDGALAILDGGALLAIHDAPTVSLRGKSRANRRDYDEGAIREILLSIPSGARAFIESVHSMPGQGVRSMFSMGVGFGLWRGALSALGLSYTLVTPQAWKKVCLAAYGLKDKNAAYQAMSRQFPAAPLKGTRGGILDGRADALAIAEYGQRSANGLGGVVVMDD